MSIGDWLAGNTGFKGVMDGSTQVVPEMSDAVPVNMSGGGAAGILDKMGNWMQSGQNVNQLAYVLDQMGSKLAPQNMMAGIGTQLAQGGVATQKANQQKTEMGQFIKQVIEGLTGSKQPGHSGLTITRNDDGTMNYSIKGLGGEVSPPAEISQTAGLGRTANTSSITEEDLESNANAAFQALQRK